MEVNDFGHFVSETCLHCQLVHNTVCLFFSIPTDLYVILQRVPDSFISAIDGNIPSKLRIICNTLKWRARFDSEVGKICGLADFMEYYGIKLFNIILFEYHGNGVFSVKVYKTAAIETNYPTILPNEWKKQKNEWKDEEFMVEYGNLEFQKAIALLGYNALLNLSQSFEISIGSVDFEEGGINLVSLGLFEFNVNFFDAPD